jgi:hypothetical protein
MDEQRFVYSDEEWNESVAHRPQRDVVPAQPLLLHRHWMWANCSACITRTLCALVGCRTRRVSPNVSRQRCSCGVIEAFGERGIELQGRFGEEIASMSEPLRRCRNAVFRVSSRRGPPPCGQQPCRRVPPASVDRSILVLNALLGLGTVLAPLFVALFDGLGFWWGLPVTSSALLTLLIVVSLGLPLRVAAAGATAARARGRIPSRFWIYAGFAVLYGICETLNGNWSPLSHHSR